MKFNAELHESVFSQALIKDKAWNTEDNKRQSTTNKEKQYQKRFTSERDILYISQQFCNSASLREKFREKSKDGLFTSLWPQPTVLLK